MILVTRPSGDVVAINCDLVERVVPGATTLIWLVDGTVEEVTESVTEIIDRVRDFRASVVHVAEAMAAAPTRAQLRLLDDIRLTDERGA